LSALANCDKVFSLNWRTRMSWVGRMWYPCTPS
jgi:hypothetical protein